MYVTNENDNGPFFVGGIMPDNPEIDENRPSGSFIAAVNDVITSYFCIILRSTGSYQQEMMIWGFLVNCALV